MSKKKKKRRKHSKRWYIGMRNRIIFGIIVLALLFLLGYGIVSIVKVVTEKTDNTEKKAVNKPGTELTTESEIVEEKEPDYLRKYDSIEVADYNIYGSHFNLTGTFETEESVRNLFLHVVEKDSTGPADYKDRYVLYYNSVTGSFTTAKQINEGICLETIEAGDYYLMLGVSYANGTTSYYSLKYKGEQPDLEYYTMTDPSIQASGDDEVAKQNKRLLVTKKKDYFRLLVEETVLPSDVYDIVIDAGHGGTDPGATYGDTYESDVVLVVALRAKVLLEQMGYKVCLTRNGSEDPQEMMAYTMYDEDGRVNVSCRSKAKYAVSLHLNSNGQVTTGGVQVYGTCRGNSDFAKRIADSIVSVTGSDYSKMQTGKKGEGYYTSALTQSDIDEMNAKADEKGYEHYNLTLDTDALFMIRELGGKVTNAYIDGRNEVYGKNLYYDSDMGVESLLVELGFMSVAEDRNRLLNNAESYAEAVAQGIREQIVAVQNEDHIISRISE